MHATPFSTAACLIAAVAVAAGCGGGSAKPATATDAAGTDLPADASQTAPPTLPAPADRGWGFSRNVVHIHSAYSHDACDNWITDHPGEVSPTCLQQFRTALCESGLDVAFVTDHPAHMKDYPFAELLQIKPELGDTPVGPAGKPYASLVHCPASAALPAHDLVRTEGFEGTHNLAIGNHGHFANADLEGVSFSMSTATTVVQAGVAEIHANQGLSCNAHSEEDDITAQRIVDGGLDCMEIYNTHANFLTIVGMSAKGAKMNLGRVFLLDRLVGPASQSPDPDLAVMIMLDIQPEAAFTKWQAVNAQRAVTAVIGNDVHQNVKLDAFCGPGGQLESLCDALVDKYPNLVKQLKAGGPVILADGKRIDDYGRLLRWISNRTLVPKGTPAAELAQATQTAIKAGRTFVSYDVLGDPKGFDCAAKDQASGKWVDMGGQVSMGSTLWLRVPDVQPMPWAHWQAQDSHNPADLPSVSLVIWRIVAGKAEAEKMTTLAGAPGEAIQFTPDQPGKYHVEVRIVPRHLRALMKGLQENMSAKEMVDIEQRWVVGNPIGFGL